MIWRSWKDRREKYDDIYLLPILIGIWTTVGEILNMLETFLNYLLKNVKEIKILLIQSKPVDRLYVPSISYLFKLPQTILDYLQCGCVFN